MALEIFNISPLKQPLQAWNQSLSLCSATIQKCILKATQWPDVSTENGLLAKQQAFSLVDVRPFPTHHSGEQLPFHQAAADLLARVLSEGTFQYPIFSPCLVFTRLLGPPQFSSLDRRWSLVFPPVNRKELNKLRSDFTVSARAIISYRNCWCCHCACHSRPTPKWGKCFHLLH